MNAGSIFLLAVLALTLGFLAYVCWSNVRNPQCQCVTWCDGNCQKGKASE